MTSTLRLLKGLVEEWPTAAPTRRWIGAIPHDHLFRRPYVRLTVLHMTRDGGCLDDTVLAYHP